VCVEERWRLWERAERIVFSVSNDRILFAGGRHVCMCISIVLMGIPPVSYTIVYMQNRNNCVCVTLLSKREKKEKNEHTKSEKRKIETTQ
jgi:hypothetical protein